MTVRGGETGIPLDERRLNLGYRAAQVFAESSQTSSVFLGMGESNCAWNRRALLHRDTMLAAAAVYRGKEAARSPSQAHYCPVPCHPYPLKSHCPF